MKIGRLIGVGLGVALAALECVHNIGAMMAPAAAAAYTRRDDYAARAAAARALVFNHYAIDNTHVYLAALKGEQRWTDLEREAEKVAAWYPDAAGLWPLAGEAAFQSGRNAEAVDYLWKGFAIDPVPKVNPAALWGMSMQAAHRAEGPKSQRTQAAAQELMRLADRDAKLADDVKAMLKQEAEQIEHDR